MSRVGNAFGASHMRNGSVAAARRWLPATFGQRPGQLRRPSDPQSRNCCARRGRAGGGPCATHPRGDLLEQPPNLAATWVPRPGGDQRSGSLLPVKQLGRGQGTLYVNVPSEYPLLANLFFALVRLVSGALNTQPTALLSFEVTWVTCGWWMWLAVLFLLWRNAPRRAIWLWLNPAALYFSLYRFDVYLVAGTLLCLLAARDGRIRTAALLLGATVALKGFAILFVPAFALWVWQNKVVERPPSPRRSPWVRWPRRWP